MVTTVLLDTNVLSEAARPNPEPGVLTRLTETAPEAGISVITWHELRYGVERLPSGTRRRALHAFVARVGDRFPIIAYDRAAADWHAVARARLDRAGRTPSFADGQIAATAAVNNLRLVTRNVRDFTGFTGLVVESWWS